MGRYVFRLPDVGEGIAEAEIVEWHVALGDRIEEDAPLVDVMTDKATVELTSPVSGVVVERAGEEGSELAVGETLAVLETDADVEAPTDEAAPPPAPPAARPPPPETRPAPQPAAATARPLASPATRRRAKDAGIDLASVEGSGPQGRVLDRDLARAATQPAQPLLARREGVTDVKVIGLRRRIAERMSDAWSRIPHITYVDEVDVTELESLRAHLNATRPEARLSLPPFLITAMVRVLPDFPQINATFDDTAGVVHRHAPVHMGVAVQTDDGLMVPVVRHAEARDLWDLAAEIGRLAAAARDGKAARDELSGSTITLTSLGVTGGVATTPIINAPEVAIVGPNKIESRAVVRDGQIVVRKMMNISSSFDHRVVDGADAAAFIQAVKIRLEHPALLFMP